VIELVTAALVEFGLIEPNRTPRYNVGLTKGDTVWFHAFVEDGRFFHVKVSDAISLRNEADICEATSRVFDGFVPEPLGYCVKDGWDIFITEGVNHLPLPATALIGSNGARPPADALSVFFEASRHSPQLHSGSELETLLANLEQRFKDSELAPLLSGWCSGHGRAKLDSLGSVMQHGDFVQNNIGVAARRLIIFDWEDYGKVCVPGFDLSTLLVSSLEFETAVATMRDGNLLVDRFSSVLKSACRALDIQVKDFLHLLPLYLLTFLHLKADYAAEIRRRITSLLKPLATPARI